MLLCGRPYIGNITGLARPFVCLSLWVLNSRTKRHRKSRIGIRTFPEAKVGLTGVRIFSLKYWATVEALFLPFLAHFSLSFLHHLSVWSTAL